MAPPQQWEQHFQVRGGRLRLGWGAKPAVMRCLTQRARCRPVAQASPTGCSLVAAAATAAATWQAQAVQERWTRHDGLAAAVAVMALVAAALRISADLSLLETAAHLVLVRKFRGVAGWRLPHQSDEQGALLISFRATAHAMAQHERRCTVSSSHPVPPNKQARPPPLPAPPAG